MWGASIYSGVVCISGELCVYVEGLFCRWHVVPCYDISRDIILQTVFFAFGDVYIHT